jgi:uncharacterized protein
VRVWVDLANSPHSLLFDPVVRRLRERGHEVELTARDNAQTVELALARWPEVTVIGGEAPGGRLRKAAAMGRRAMDLRKWARARRPDVALSHNSYGQIVAARTAGTRVVTAMDFEHQPANHLAFRLAHAILIPSAVPVSAIARQGARARKVRRYPGYKEELYLGDFEPQPGVAADLGARRERDAALVVVRTPPSRALYHRFGNPLFLGVLGTLAEQSDVEVVILPRHPEQRAALESAGLPNAVVARHSVDSRSLLREADLVIGAGGTMTREAALMGVPTFTVYAGTAPAVDRALEQAGRLTRLVDPRQAAGVGRRAKDPDPLKGIRERGREILDVFVEAVEDTRPA